GTFQIFFLIPTSMGMRIPVSHTMTALFGVAMPRRSRSLIGMAPFRITLCFLAAALFFPVSPGSAQEIRPLPSHQSLDWYPDEAGKPQPIETLEDWKKRRAAIIAGFEEVAGPLPSRDNLPDLDVRVTETVDTDSY